MLNVVILIGRLTRDVDLRYTPSGKAVARMRLAVDRGGQGDDNTDFIDVVVWEKQAEVCSQYLAKGRLVAVQGRLQIRSYDAQDGSRRIAPEVVAHNVRFLESRRQTEAGGDQGGAPNIGNEISFGDDLGDVPF